jgi:hypothetical protein
MHKILAFALLLLTGSLLFSQTSATATQPSVYFGGQRFYIGMSQREALSALSSCCKLSPPAESASDNSSHFVILKGQPAQPLVGAIYFSAARVAHLSRELAPDVDTSNEDLVAFVRALKRALPDGTNSAVITVRHDSASNAESGVVTVVFSNGRGLEVRIGTLDKSSATISSRRDFVSLDETLGASQ